MRTTALFLIPLALLTECQAPKTVVFSNDNLEINQPIEQLEELLATLEAQQPRNYTIANISFLYGIKLHLLFEKYLESLPEDERPAAISEQKSWQIAHDKKVSEAYSEYEGGTYADFNAGEAAVKSYKARTNAILRRMGGK